MQLTAGVTPVGVSRECMSMSKLNALCDAKIKELLFIQPHGPNVLLFTQCNDVAVTFFHIHIAINGDLDLTVYGLNFMSDFVFAGLVDMVGCALRID